MTEAADILYYVLAFAGAAFLPAFLWNLWLAPHRIGKEARDDVEKGLAGGLESLRKENQRQMESVSSELRKQVGEIVQRLLDSSVHQMRENISQEVDAAVRKRLGDDEEPQP